MAQQEEATLPTETVDLAKVRPHPDNYLDHPQEEIDHIKESIRANGIYRPLVIARDGTLLAGHGVREALMQLGWTHAPAVRLDIDPDKPKAIKVLSGDNEIGRMSVRNDRMLADLMHQVASFDAVGLLGTGFDDDTLNRLLSEQPPAFEPNTMPTITAREYGEGDVTKAGDKLGTAIPGPIQLREVMCPHCGGKFGIDE